MAAIPFGLFILSMLINQIVLIKEDSSTIDKLFHGSSKPDTT